MKIKTVKEHIVVFSVQYFEATEGGMDSDSFGNVVDTLSEAIDILELARIKEGRYEWVIVADVLTKITEDAK